MQLSKEISYVTISIDDGHPTDLKTAELLDDVGLRATFYVPAANRERPILSRSAIKALSQRFEIGAHSMTHRRLTSLSLSEARHEITAGKEWL